MRFDLAFDDPKNSGSRRTELGAYGSAGVEEPGAERWYGFSIYLPASWIVDPQAESVTQWHQTGGECSQFCSPPLSILTRNGQWVISQNWQQTHTPGDWFFSTTEIGPYETGRWTDWVVHVKWSTGDDGVLDIWKDGVPVSGFFHKVGRNDDFGERDAGFGNYMKIGIYKWPWNPQIPSPPSPSRRVMYHDALRIVDGAGSYADVAPGVTCPVATDPVNQLRPRLDSSVNGVK